MVFARLYLRRMATNNPVPDKFKIFGGKPLLDFLSAHTRQLQELFQSESDEYLSNVDEEDYISYFVEENSIAMPVLDFNGVTASNGVRMIKGEQFPPGFFVEKGKTYSKQVVIYYIPCGGNVELLKYDVGTANDKVCGYIQDGCLCFELIDYYNDLTKVKQFASRNLARIKNEFFSLSHALADYNYNIKGNIERSLKRRKERIDNIVKVLGVPIKRQENLPAAYNIPTLQNSKELSVKPQAVSGRNVEYVVEESVYNEILQVIHGVGKVFERLPATYVGKREEHLRDHFLLYLQPRYKGNATGETFNKRGKTDILIRHENTTVFIAECKFWKGSKAHLDTISQLLGYLTWRDSKAAVIVFVTNKNFSSILRAVEQSVSQHPNFLRLVDKKEETWFNYRFYLNGDKKREIQLAVLLFHLPRVEKELRGKRKTVSQHKNS